MMAATLPVLAVTGMNAEARIAGGSGVATLAGGGDAARLALLLQGALSRGARAVISFGIAGGLAPGLKPGTVIIARAVDDGETVMLTDPVWLKRLSSALPDAIVADLVGVDHMVVGHDAKTHLHATTGAAAVDMESHIAARLAALHQVPFAALRIVADPAERTLPHAATVGMRPDGSTDVKAVLKALARRPADLPALIRTAFDARAAFSALKHSRSLLCGHLGFGEIDLAREDGVPRPLVDIDVGTLGVFGVGTDVSVENR
ncbi:phosphorylase [Lichenihabitans psoromatis]|uniref:phosphorylase n=1 Tax=Lichenihabitans psoromatis TaxID=2528642 RepID=UPI001FE00B75|nr:phosphorylase [Lichenihabitans psoromatis]